MRRLVVRPLALVGLLLAVLAGSGGPVHRPAGPSGSNPPVARSRPEMASAALERATLAFLADGDGSRFVARGLGYDVAVSPDEVSVSAAGSRPAVRMRLVGARPGADATAHDPLPGRTNLLLGDDPSRWRTGVPTFGRVEYRGVWEGIDVVYRGQGHRLEYDFVVAPGADPGAVELSFPDTSDRRLTDEGDLELEVAAGDVRMTRPVVYQESGGSRSLVDGSFDLRPDGRVGFSVGPHDRALPLVIDPVVLDSTYLGGGGADLAHAVAVGADGNVYVAGSTESADFPTEAARQPGLVESGDVRTDAFVAKLNRGGDGFVYSTYLGGGGRDTAYGIAVGHDGSAYVTGDTDSSDFPLSRPVQRALGGATDGFVAKIAPQGAVLQYSTYLGGGAPDLARGITVDQSGNAYVAGSTASADFPVAGTPFRGTQIRPDDTDAFVTKVDASGSAWAWSTYLGGSADDHAVAVAVDAQGRAHVTGDTRSTDFPLAAPLQAGLASPHPGANGVPPDAFVSRLDAAGSTLVYSTYLGGAEADQGSDVAVDGAGNAYVTGSTGSTNFPVVGAPQVQKGGDFDAFLAKVNADGSTLAYSTYFGGSRADGGASVSVDGEGRASITGATASSDLRTVGPFQAAKSGGYLDGFVVTFDPDGVRPLVASYFGANGDDQGVAVATAADGALVVVGYTTSTDFPTASPIQESRGGGTGDAFVTRVGDAPPVVADDAPLLPGRERRIQILVGSTIALFVAAGLQTLWLRRRPQPDVPPPLPAGVGAAGPAATRLDPQAEWLASAKQTARPTAFPNLSSGPKPVPAPPLRRRKPARVEGGPPPEELAVPDLLSDSGSRPGPVAPPPAEGGAADELDMWAPRDAELRRPHVGADPGDGRAGTGEFDLLDPALWGNAEPEPEPDITSDPTWWEFLVDDSEAADSSEPRPGRPSAAQGRAVAEPPAGQPPAAGPPTSAPPGPTTDPRSMQTPPPAAAEPPTPPPAAPMAEPPVATPPVATPPVAKPSAAKTPAARPIPPTPATPPGSPAVTPPPVPPAATPSGSPAGSSAVTPPPLPAATPPTRPAAKPPPPAPPVGKPVPPTPGSPAVTPQAVTPPAATPSTPPAAEPVPSVAKPPGRVPTPPEPTPLALEPAVASGSGTPPPAAPAKPPSETVPGGVSPPPPSPAARRPATAGPEPAGPRPSVADHPVDPGGVAAAGTVAPSGDERAPGVAATDTPSAAPTGERPGAVPPGPSPRPRGDEPAAAAPAETGEDWVADLWAAGESSTAGSRRSGARPRRPSPPMPASSEPDGSAEGRPSGPDASGAPGEELSVNDLLGEDLPIPDVPPGKPAELTVRALIDEDLGIPDHADDDEEGSAGEKPGAVESADPKPAATETEPRSRPLPEAKPGRARRPWSRGTPRR